MKRYGQALGLAFQLVDDSLDYAGDAAALGKNVGDDLAEGKLTLPLIVALRDGDASTRRVISEALARKDASALPAVQAALQACDALGYTQRAAEREIAKAKAALEVLSPPPIGTPSRSSRTSPCTALSNATFGRRGGAFF